MTSSLDECFPGLFKVARLLNRKVTQDVLGVRISEQKLYHFHDRKLIATYPVSTSRNAPSNVENSGGTPTGLHKVAVKIGHGEQLGMVFKARIPQGYLYSEATDPPGTPLITTRIFRLRGLEPGVNAGGRCDSFRRYIYIHGTNFEELIGTAASGGCVNMRNEDVLALFDAVPEDTLVWIVRN